MKWDSQGRLVLDLCEWFDELAQYAVWAEENKAPCGWAACHNCKYYYCVRGYGEGDEPYCTESNVGEYFSALQKNDHEHHRIMMSIHGLFLWFNQDDGEVMFPVECIWRKDKGGEH